MGAAKSGGQEVRVGEVFMECAEKKRFPGFGFFWQGDNCALRGEDGSQRGKCNSQDRRLATGCILTGSRVLKWKSRLNRDSLLPTRNCRSADFVPGPRRHAIVRDTNSG